MWNNINNKLIYIKNKNNFMNLILPILLIKQIKDIYYNIYLYIYI